MNSYFIIYFLTNIEYISIQINIELDILNYYSNTLIYRKIFWMLVVIFIALGYIGQLEVNSVTIELGQNFTVLYFLIIFMLSVTEEIFMVLFGILVTIMVIMGVFSHGLFDNIYIEHASI